MRTSILTSVAIGATMASGTGRMIRCESANFHLDASGANAVIDRYIDEAFARTDPKDHDLEPLEP